METGDDLAALLEQLAGCSSDKKSDENALYDIATGNPNQQDDKVAVPSTSAVSTTGREECVDLCGDEDASRQPQRIQEQKLKEALDKMNSLAKSMRNQSDGMVTSNVPAPFPQPQQQPPPSYHQPIPQGPPGYHPYPPPGYAHQHPQPPPPMYQQLPPPFTVAGHLPPHSAGDMYYSPPADPFHGNHMRPPLMAVSASYDLNLAPPGTHPSPARSHPQQPGPPGAGGPPPERRPVDMDWLQQQEEFVKQCVAARTLAAEISKTQKPEEARSSSPKRRSMERESFSKLAKDPPTSVGGYTSKEEFINRERDRLLEIREKLLRDARGKQTNIDAKNNKYQTLDSEMRKLKKEYQDGCRRLQKTKDGHKNPLLVENEQLQKSLQGKLGDLRAEADDLDKQKKLLLYKINKIEDGLGMPRSDILVTDMKKADIDERIAPSPDAGTDTKHKKQVDGSKPLSGKRQRTVSQDKSPKAGKRVATAGAAIPAPPPGPKTKKKKNNVTPGSKSKDSSGSGDSSSSSSNSSSSSSSEADDDSTPKKGKKKKKKKKKKAAATGSNSVRYYDPGSHWCRVCNQTFATALEMFAHLHGAVHKNTFQDWIRPPGGCRKDFIGAVRKEAETLAGGPVVYGLHRWRDEWLQLVINMTEYRAQWRAAVNGATSGFAAMDQYDRPWMAKQLDETPSDTDKAASVKSYQGLEFTIPSWAVYCKLCSHFSGDAVCAEEHVKSAAHNESYARYIKRHPGYEQRLRMEKAAGLLETKPAKTKAAGKKAKEGGSKKSTSKDAMDLNRLAIKLKGNERSVIVQKESEEQNGDSKSNSSITPKSLDKDDRWEEKKPESTNDTAKPAPGASKKPPGGGLSFKISGRKLLAADQKSPRDGSEAAGGAASTSSELRRGSEDRSSKSPPRAYRGTSGMSRSAQISEAVRRVLKGAGSMEDRDLLTREGLWRSLMSRRSGSNNQDSSKDNKWETPEFLDNAAVRSEFDKAMNEDLLKKREASRRSRSRSRSNRSGGRKSPNPSWSPKHKMSEGKVRSRSRHRSLDKTRSRSPNHRSLTRKSRSRERSVEPLDKTRSRSRTRSPNRSHTHRRSRSPHRTRPQPHRRSLSRTRNTGGGHKSRSRSRDRRTHDSRTSRRSSRSRSRSRGRKVTAGGSSYHRRGSSDGAFSDSSTRGGHRPYFRGGATAPWNNRGRGRYNAGFTSVRPNFRWHRPGYQPYNGRGGSFRFPQNYRLPSGRSDPVRLPPAPTSSSTDEEQTQGKQEVGHEKSIECPGDKVENNTDQEEGGAQEEIASCEIQPFPTPDNPASEPHDEEKTID